MNNFHLSDPARWRVRAEEAGCEEGNEAVVNRPSRRHGDFARKPLRAPREANLAPQVIGDHLFHHARAEALVRGWRDGGAVRLGPTQHESAVCRARPLHLDATRFAPAPRLHRSRATTPG